jgi:hypothetical protein
LDGIFVKKGVPHDIANDKVFFARASQMVYKEKEFARNKKLEHA